MAPLAGPALPPALERGYRLSLAAAAVQVTCLLVVVEVVEAALEGPAQMARLALALWAGLQWESFQGFLGLAELGLVVLVLVLQLSRRSMVAVADLGVDLLEAPQQAVVVALFLEEALEEVAEVLHQAMQKPPVQREAFPVLLLLAVVDQQVPQTVELVELGLTAQQLSWGPVVEAVAGKTPVLAELVEMAEILVVVEVVEAVEHLSAEQVGLVAVVKFVFIHSSKNPTLYQRSNCDAPRQLLSLSKYIATLVANQEEAHRR